MSGAFKIGDPVVLIHMDSETPIFSGPVRKVTATGQVTAGGFRFKWDGWSNQYKKIGRMYSLLLLSPAEAEEHIAKRRAMREKYEAIMVLYKRREVVREGVLKATPEQLDAIEAILAKVQS